MASEPRPGALASPLTLLLEAAERGETAQEVLLLSYTLDLGFFERAALGLAQSLGARVTVVGDAAMVTHDPWAVRRAGRSYAAGLASCSGAFHPKLVVIAGAERVTVAVGSGNLTMAGWQANHELWTVVHGGPTAAPATLAALGAWLRGLPEAVRFGRGVAAAFERVASLLEAFEPTEAGPRLVSSLEGPIIEQLPAGPVEELCVFAPFHDAGAVGLARLVERLEPRAVRVGVQPGLSVYDGATLATAAGGGQVVGLGSERYRHGKLFEVCAGGRRWALTGSPNCSGAALLRGLRSGGNCELGLVVDDLPDSLMPEGVALGADVLATHGYRPRPAARPGIVVLGAARVDDGLEVVIAQPIKAAARVDVAGADAPPGTWERIADVGPGPAVFVVARGVEGGARLRVVGEGVGGQVVSNTVFVLDPSRVLRRAVAGDVRRRTEPFDLFQDAGLAERFVGDLGSLRAGLRPGAAQVVRAAGGGGSASGAHRDYTYGSWDEYLDDCAGRVGSALLRFALGLPTVEAGPAGPVRADWDEDAVDESEPGLEDDAEDLGQAPDAPTPPRRLPDLAGQPARVRRRYARWAGDLAAKAPGLGPAERLLALRLVLWTAAAGAWDDLGWMTPVARAAEALAIDEELPPQVEPATGSLAAVALAVLSAYAPRSRATPELRIFQRASRTLAHLLVASDDRYVEEYSRVLDEAFGPAVHPGAVSQVAEEVVDDDPVAVAVRALVEELGHVDAHRHGSVLHVNGRVANPTLAALDVVAVAEEAEPVGAWAGDDSAWALAVWRAPDLAVFTGPKPLTWAVYRLSGLATPSVLAHERSIDNRFLVARSWPGQALHATAAELLSKVGLEAPGPPDCA